MKLYALIVGFALTMLGLAIVGGAALATSLAWGGIGA